MNDRTAEANPLTRMQHWMRTSGWHLADEGDMRHRLWTVAISRRPWYDWGHPLMTLVGRARCGNYDPPRGRDMWYRDNGNGAFQTTYSYGDLDAYRGEWDWKVFDLQDDGHTMMMGYYPDPKDRAGRIAFYGLGRREQGLFLRWFLIEHKLRGEWLGLRRWLYYKGLHAAVHRKVPFACQAVPARNSGGYDHWHCQLKKRHDLPHRYGSYTWGGKGHDVDYAPQANA